LKLYIIGISIAVLLAAIVYAAGIRILCSSIVIWCDAKNWAFVLAIATLAACFALIARIDEGKFGISGFSDWAAVLGMCACLAILSMWISQMAVRWLNDTCDTGGTLCETLIPHRVRPLGVNCPPSHPVKGNRPSRIFHAPGTQFYNGTRPEVCFSDWDSALAAGYLPPRSQMSSDIPNDWRFDPKLWP
jgi:hypothetical protein